jgi:anti-sigma-K factor RskA
MTAHGQYRDNLPLYAAGALLREESEQIERHLAECSACREELRAMNEAAAQIAMAVGATAPRPHVREQLLARLDDESARQGAPVEMRHPASLRRPRIWLWAPALVAAMLAIAFVTALKRDRDLRRENQDLAARLEAAGAVTERAQQLVSLLSAGDAQRVTLVAAGAKPLPEARTVYSARRRSLVMLASNLSPLPPHKTYELWLLPANGSAPVPAGTFKPDERGSGTVVLLQFGDGLAAKGFAVTVENDPGSAAPTMPILLVGTS